MMELIHGIVKEMMEKQEMWLRAVLLKELGEDSYGKTDKEIALEAQARGYQFIRLTGPRETDDPINPVMCEVRDKNNKVISSYRIKFNYHI